MSSIWRNRNFVLLFSAQIVSLTGSGVTTVGLALFAWQLTGGPSAAAVVGNALMLRILAFLLFSQPAGVLADRWDRRKMLITSDVARCALVGLFPFITAVWQVYALVFAINAVTAFFTPAYDASIPDVVGKDDYVGAVSLSRVAVDVENVAAPALAGLLVAFVGVRWVFWFDAATYLASAALVIATVFPARTPQATPAFSARAFLKEATHGTRVLLREPSLRQALALSFAEATAGAAAIVVTVVYVRDVLRGTNAAVALAMASVGVGSALVALALARITGRSEERVRGVAALHGLRHRWAQRALLGGGLVLGVALLPGALVPSFVLFAILWMLNGAGQALIAIPSSTLLVEHTQEGERGRAYAAHFALTHFFWLIAYPAVGHAAVRWGAPATFTAAGGVCLIVTVIAAAIGSGKVQPHRHAQ